MQKKHPRGIILPVIIIVLGVVLAGSITAVLVVRKQPGSNANGVQCTTEAKLCSDGSSVGRVPPSCAFAPCPTTNANGSAGVPCEQLTDRIACGRRSDCLKVDLCPYITASTWAEQCGKDNPKNGACVRGGFSRCAPLDCTAFDEEKLQATPSITTPDGVVSLSCARDEDCRLIDPSESYATCCGGGPTCLDIDSTFVAVNATSFNEAVRIALAAKDCSKYMCPGGPQYVPPNCPNVEFTAKCTSGLCQMVAKP